MELRDLRWALVVSQHRSLRRAAESLHIRQSTLSRRLRDVEQRLGAALFERTNGGTRLTLAGQEFLDAARRIVKETDDALTRVRSRSRGDSGYLKIGVNASLSAGNLRATLIEHRRRFPDVEIRAVDGTSDQLLTELASSGVDIAIMIGCRAEWTGRTLPLWSERVVLAVPDDHPFSAQAAIQWPALISERLLIPQRGPGPELAALIGTKLRHLGPARTINHDVSLDRLLSLVGAGYGLLMGLEGATGAHYDGVTYREVHDEEGPARLGFMAYWREDNGNPTLRPFLDILRERYPDLSAPARI